VNLNGLPLANFDSILLFDGDQSLVGNRIFGAFASSTVTGTALAHRVVYDQVNGDILVQLIPEPSGICLLGLGLVLAGMKRRTA
jgi:hypothetical protein